MSIKTLCDPCGKKASGELKISFTNFNDYGEIKPDEYIVCPKCFERERKRCVSQKRALNS